MAPETAGMVWMSGKRGRGHYAGWPVFLLTAVILCYLDGMLAYVP